MHGNREVPEPSPAKGGDRAGKAKSHKPAMHGSGKSDIGIVPGKAANKVPNRDACGLRSRWREGR